MTNTNGNIVRIIDTSYRQDEDNPWPVRIYMPEKQGEYPALLDVHCGAWSWGSCRDNESIDIALTASGIVVFAFECRKVPAYTYLAQGVDINYAARWIKTHGKDYSVSQPFMRGMDKSHTTTRILFRSFWNTSPLIKTASAGQ
jgi:acetyl esterase